MSCNFGMPTLIEKDSIEDNLKLCKELELSFLELNMNLPYCMPKNNEIKKLLELKHKYNVDFTLHFPEEIDFGCFYEEIREANIKLFKDIALWASKFGAKKINIHLNSGIYFTLPNKKVFVYEKNNELFLKNFKDSLYKIINIAEPLGIKLCVENMQVHKFVEEAFLELCNISGVNFTWDVGHDAMTGYKIRNIYLNHPHKVSHMHLHDYNGVSDHQVLFSGNIPIKERLRFAEENNLSVLIETKTEEALRKSVKRLREYLKI